MKAREALNILVERLHKEGLLDSSNQIRECVSTLTSWLSKKYPVETGDEVYFWLGRENDPVDRGRVQTLFVEDGEVVGFTVEFTETKYSPENKRYRMNVVHEYDTFSICDLGKIIFKEDPWREVDNAKSN